VSRGAEFDLFDVPTGKKLSSCPIGAFAISGRGRYLAVRHEKNRIDVYHADSGKCVWQLTPPSLGKKRKGTFFTPRFSGDERYLAAEFQEWVENERGESELNQVLLLWDVESGKLVKENVLWRNIWTGVIMARGGQGSLLQALAVSKDHRFVALAHRDSTTIYILETATGMCRGTLDALAGKVVSLDFSPDGRMLASGHGDTTALVWDLNRPLGPGKFKSRLTSKELEACWQTLHRRDAEKAGAAIWALIHAAKDSVPFLKERLPVAVHPEPKTVAALLKELDSDSFRTRSRAEAEIERHGELLLGDLKSALGDRPTLEWRRRLERLIAKAQKDNLPFETPERLAQWRAIEVLERIDSPASKRVLRALAAGARGARLTTTAQSALTRLAALQIGKRD
jgi:hypothetical protein